MTSLRATLAFALLAAFISPALGGDAPSGKAAKPSPLELRDMMRLRKTMRARLVWESNRAGNWEIFVMDFADAKPVQLTKNDCDDHRPVWAPDGSAVYFDRQAQGEGHPCIMRMKPDGSAQEVVAPNGFHPSLTAGGATLVFVRKENGKSRIIAKDLKAGAERELLPKAQPWLVNSRVDQPAISPDGKRLAFFSTYRGNYVRAVNVDGSDAGIIGRGSQPDFSPDGECIAWVLGSVHKIYANKPDGSKAEELAVFDQPRPYMHFPRWSNKPNVIVFAAGPHFDTWHADYEVFLKRVGKDDARAMRLTFHSGTDRWPDLHIEEILADGRPVEGIETRDAWIGVEWADPTSVRAETAEDGNTVLVAQYKSEGKDKAGVWLACQEDFSKATHLMFDALNDSDREIKLALAFHTGPQGAYHESALIPVRPGKWMRGLVIDLAAEDFKTEAAQWHFKAALADRDQIKGMGILIYNAPKAGRLKLDAITLIE